MHLKLVTRKSKQALGLAKVLLKSPLASRLSLFNMGFVHQLYSNSSFPVRL